MPTKKPTTKPPNRFLDTSIARSTLTGTSKYKKYLKGEFGKDKLYVSQFVKMEFRRSFLINLVEFFLFLDLPYISSVEEAFKGWSHKFKTSQLKAIIQICTELFISEKVALADPNDKQKALDALVRLIKRYHFLIEGYTDVGVDTPRCARARVPLQIRTPTVRQDLRRFVQTFNDVAKCRSNCVVNDFLLKKNLTVVNRFTTRAKSLKHEKETQGFLKIVSNLDVVLTKGDSACSCKRCEKIGDAIIAIDTPKGFSVQHSDYAFDQLCDELGKPHNRLLSESTFLKSLGATVAVSP